MSGSTVESALRIATPVLRRPWVFVVVVVLMLAAAVFLADGYRQYRRVLELEAAVRGAGGNVTIQAPIWQRMWAQWRNVPEAHWTIVGLGGPTIDGAWLRNHDDLRGLNIEDLLITDCSFTGEDLARLVAKHPLETIDARSGVETDVAAAAFGTSYTLRRIHLIGTDLSDAGFQMLPLERLEVLSVADTDVTSAGLQELRRCEKLWWLTLDGRQFDDDAVELLGTMERVQGLGLHGKDVTDEHLLRLRELDIERVSLVETSATQAGIDGLKQAVPGCWIEVR